MKPLLLLSPDGAPAASSNPTTTTRTPAQTFNKAFLSKLEEARQVARAAQKPEYAAIWADWELPADVGAQLEALVAQTDDLLQRAVNAKSEKVTDTSNKSEAKAHIIAAIQRVQSGAKVKYHHAPDEKTQLERFFVGVKLANNDGELDNIADALLLLLQNETLPGVKEAQIQNLRDALAQFKAAEDSQTDNADSSEGLRARAVKLLEESLDPLRRKIQLAVDAEFPYYDLDSRTARKEFDLPLTRPLS